MKDRILMPIKSLSTEQLSTRISVPELPFSTMQELEHNIEFLGQQRAKDALVFGLETRRKGYNLFAMGNSGTGRISMVMRHLEAKAQLEKPQPDWIYVNNFDESREPWAVQLPTGYGKRLVSDCQMMVGRLLVTIPAAFENPSYQRRKSTVDKEFNQKFESAIETLEAEANAQGFALYQDAFNISFSPVIDGKPIDDITFTSLPPEKREVISKAVDDLEDKLTEALLEMPQWKRESYDAMQVLNSSTIESASSPIISEMEEKYRGLAGIQIYFKELRKHLVKLVLENFNLLESPELKNDKDLRELLQHTFVPNLLVSNNPTSGAPVVYEAHPTFANLFGRIEYWNDGGAFATSYQYIRSGALHRANGGYLILEVEKIFDDPYIWGQLKQALQTQELKLDPPTLEGQSTVTIGLSPHGVPLDIKVVLVGSREFYYLLQDQDSEFSELFRVLVDFDEHLDKNDGSVTHLAQLVRTHSETEGFAEVTRDGFIELVKFSSRLCGHQDQLTTRFGEVFELLGEAEVMRSQKHDEKIDRIHIEEALQQREYRHSRIRNEMLEEVLQGQIIIHTEGEVVGSINGLTIWEIGSTDFGTPARITATVFPGNKGIVDIERESELGLSIHSKGVLILSGYLSNRYAKEFTLTLSANIVMEQSYGLIDGDSASLAELCALISAVTDKPILQSMAVTGSINQFGEVQAIGGVNEKIEGFFGLCKARGLTGKQGVIIPKANQSQLMLKKEVIEAVEQGLFSVFAVSTVDEALELLCLSESGTLTELNDLISKNLKHLHDVCEEDDEEDEEHDDEIKRAELSQKENVERNSDKEPVKKSNPISASSQVRNYDSSSSQMLKNRLANKSVSSPLSTRENKLKAKVTKAIAAGIQSKSHKNWSNS
ncbi:Lon protease family protein [Pleionea sediminis]|uniref:Lon protease family protein n=1 Tax=Pleionea sediminis TaxID=2569479 RepID=UPI0011852EB2|nr:ATP-binding protein [Pleionea sediminis]